MTLPAPNINQKSGIFDAYFDGHVVHFHLTFDKLFQLVSHASELLVAKFDVKTRKMQTLT